MVTQIKSFSLFLFDVLKITIIALAIVLPIRYFLFQPFVVKGASMEPNYTSGDYLIIDEISYRFSSPARGDVIVFKYPFNPADRYIKRIVGLPGETIEIKNGQIYISANNKISILNETYYLTENLIEDWKNLDDIPPTTLKEGEYFVLGDNRNASSDSRRWGALPAENIIGKSVLQISLPAFLDMLFSPSY